MPERSAESPTDERLCTPLSDTNKALAIADRYMLVGSQLIGVTMRAKVESVGKTGSVSIDMTNTIPPGTKVRNSVEPLQRTGLWSVERSNRMSRERTCPEHGRCGGLDRALGIEPVAESR